MRVNLVDDDRALVLWKLSKLGLSAPELHEKGLLKVIRVIRSKGGNKIRSAASINDNPVTLKQLKYIVAPLIARVDANAAATALSKQSSRIKTLDRGVDKIVLNETFKAYKAYKQRRAMRQKIERDLLSSLPPSFNGMDVNKKGDADILRHWVEELDDFQESWRQFRGRLVEELADVEDAKQVEEDDGAARFDQPPSLSSCKRMLKDVDWETSPDGGYESLLSLKDALTNFENTYSSATEALASLTSKATYESAASAIEKARDHLYDVTVDPSSPLYHATEKSHDLLNEMDEALARCASQIENKIIGTMESTRPYISVEDLDVFILDWKTLARKHQVTPEQLCFSHIGLKSELEGAEENKERLPRAIEEEKRALLAYQTSCKELTKERKRVGCDLSLKVSARLKELGMDGAEFAVDVMGKMNVDFGAPFSTKSLWGGKLVDNIVGVDSVDFLLKNNNEEESSMGGKVEEVASSGERARILLLIETCLPGSIGSGGVYDFEGEEVEEEEEEDVKGALLQSNSKPVMVLYDEIDSHVGGRAAVAVAKLLSNQGTVGNQIISITHSAAIASIANKHLVVEKSQDPSIVKGGGVNVKVEEVRGGKREEEIARMAGGEMVGEEEGVEFAKALLQEGEKQRDASVIR
ncbi:hypothetical protein TrCOL_g8506 [Triparma columacea]|nr:hypothetical protein TrCOL_g8506 [Triparma columacea]